MSHPLRPGVRLGVDVGKARVGIARTDPAGTLAVPVETAPRDRAVARIAELVSEYDAFEVVVGRPLGLSGHHTASTDDAEWFAGQLAGAVSCSVRLVDERLSTVEASTALRQGGHSSKSQREIIDQAAAVIILQHSLESEARSGVAPGENVSQPEGE